MMHQPPDKTGRLLKAIEQALKARHERVEAERSVTNLRVAEGFAMFHLGLAYATCNDEMPSEDLPEPGGVA
ncbi:hypothetical protein [Acidocella sp.]|uniref:hypothetical protein n=1 Tax=Acidocella sp. TaxID=50710 RepID=UPI002602B84F|nr:hypothetical protein [Acidocella sp.]MDD2794387.1 hypothetical protein [Acidocella sp.]